LSLKRKEKGKRKRLDGVVVRHCQEEGRGETGKSPSCESLTSVFHPSCVQGGRERGEPGRAPSPAERGGEGREKEPGSSCFSSSVLLREGDLLQFLSLHRVDQERKKGGGKRRRPSSPLSLFRFPEGGGLKKSNPLSPEKGGEKKICYFRGERKATKRKSM